jgi:hypothetical protein
MRDETREITGTVNLEGSTRSFNSGCLRTQHRSCAAHPALGPDFRFDPPLTLKGNIVVRILDDAVRFMIGF